MDDFSAFTDAERAVFEALGRHGIRYMLVGLSAGVLQGANTATGDDIWFEDTSDARPKDLAAIPALEEALAVLRAEPGSK